MIYRARLSLVRPILPAFALVALLLLAGCAGDEGPFSVRVGTTIQSNGQLNPNFFSAPAGSRVLVVNHDDIWHNVSFGSPVNSSRNLAPNDSMTVRMPSTGGDTISISVSNGSGGSVSVY